MSPRQSPIIRAGSGDSHEARIAVLEQRFSDDMRARCSWCNDIRGAREGQWIEVLLSTAGTGITSSHVFRCLDCDPALAEAGATSFVAVPRRSLRNAAAEELPSGPISGDLDAIPEAGFSPSRQSKKRKRRRAKEVAAPKAPAPSIEESVEALAREVDVPRNKSLYRAVRR